MTDVYKAKMEIIKGGNKPKKNRQTKRKSLPQYWEGQSVYVHHETGCFQATIQEVNRIDGIWMYDVDCSTYHRGLELTMEGDYITEHCSKIPKERIPRKTMKELVERFEELNY